MVAALLTRRKTMASVTQLMNAFEAVEVMDARINGTSLDVAKAELEALSRLKKAVETRIQAYREIAVEDGKAYFKEVWTEEHVVKGHYKKRFTWAD
jgi:hypothetical protein